MALPPFTDLISLSGTHYAVGFSSTMNTLENSALLEFLISRAVAAGALSVGGRAYGPDHGPSPHRSSSPPRTPPFPRLISL